MGLAQFNSITSRDWKDALQRARAQRNDVQDQIRMALAKLHAHRAKTSKMKLTIELPFGLNHNTALLVQNFAEALGRKLYDAEIKYGYTDGWMEPDWMDKCRGKLREHLEKGDPRDVAAYCAFLWFHNEPTTAPIAQGKG